MDLVAKIPFNLYPSFIVAGSQASGKTHFARLLMEHVTAHDYYDRICVLTATPYDRDLLIESHDSLCQVPLTVANIEALIEYQEELRTLGIPRSMLIVLDDWTAQIPASAPIFKTLASYSRHLYISVIYIVQNIVSNVPTAIRSNAQFWFAFGQLADNDLNVFTSHFPDSSRYRGNLPLFAREYRSLPRRRYQFLFLSRDIDGDCFFIQPTKDVFALVPIQRPRTQRTALQRARARARHIARH